jgi:hypothetical protein
METTKAHWLNDGKDVHLIMPFAKVDQEHRTVSGFASLNNIDKSDDIVTAQASSEAFTTFRGNIREMHQPIAAGRMISFSQEPYYDANSGETFQGIYVTVYVSKGAQDTWEKVIDGTLSGFSIGGHILEEHSEYVPEVNKVIRFITKLSLFELSLVDNPANQFANVLSVSKVDGELIIKGMAAEAETQNVFWCEEDGAARASSEDSVDCVQCSKTMDNIGWIESTGETADLKKFVDDWTQKVITTQNIKDAGKESPEQNSEFANEEEIRDNIIEEAVKSEGGVNMSDVETVEKAAEIDEVVETEAVEKLEDTSEPEAVEKVEEIEESEEVVEKSEEAPAEVVAEDVVDLEKSLSEIKDFVVETVTKSSAEQSTSLEEGSKGVAEVSKGIASLVETIESMGTRLESLERATAVKKSGDDSESEPAVEKSIWNGRFASASTIVK